MMFLTHRVVALKVWRWMVTEFGVVLPKDDLVWGSMRPDFVRHSISHFPNEEIGLLHEKWDALCTMDRERQPRLFSVELGEIFHYLCDYFCYAHNEPSLQKEVWQHLKYENELHRYVKRTDFRGLPVSAADYSAVSFPDLFEYKHSEFLRQLPSFQNDLQSAYEMCLIVARMLFEKPGVASIFQIV